MMKYDDVIYRKLKTIALALFIAGAGMFLFNQGIQWKYNAQLIMEPCGACVQDHPEKEQCIRQCFAQPVQNTNPYNIKFNFTSLKEVP